MTVRAAIIEMHVVQCADRLEESLAAAAAAPWWAIVRRPALLWRARASARELTYWLNRAEHEPTHEGYADPVDGGWGGYQGACHGCAWRGPARRHAPRAAVEHEREAG